MSPVEKLQHDLRGAKQHLSFALELNRPDIDLINALCRIADLEDELEKLGFGSGEAR